MYRLLLGQLGANGDCLYATILARQLRQDYPKAHITWAISSQCVGLLRNNPHIDDVWEIEIPSWNEHAVMWRVFEREATRRLLRHEFDHVYFSQIWPNNFQNFDGTIRPSILRSYGRPITVPIENVIALTEEETQRADRWVQENDIALFEHRILFECSAKSGQSQMNVELAQEVAAHIYEALSSTTVLFCTHLPVELKHPNSRNAGELTLREIARLTHHCSFFVGAGSGATVVATSAASRKLPQIHVLAANTSMFASFAHDLEYFGLDSSHIMETTDIHAKSIARAIVASLRDGIDSTRSQYSRPPPLGFEHYWNLIEASLIKRSRYLDAAQSLLTTVKRYGWRSDLFNFARLRIAPGLAADPSWVLASRRRDGERFLDQLTLASKQ
jgi:hypothetical protein